MGFDHHSQGLKAKISIRLFLRLEVIYFGVGYGPFQKHIKNLEDDSDLSEKM